VNVREHHSLGGSDFICFDTAILYLGGTATAQPQRFTTIKSATHPNRFML